MRRLLLLVFVSLAACGGLAACAPKHRPPAAPTEPQYPAYLFPPVPQAFEGSAAAISHRTGWDALQAGDLRQAERGFGTALKNEPGFYPAEAGLGYVALARRDPKAAADRFARALAGAPTYVPALVGRGEALLAEGKEEEALASFTTALEADASLDTLHARIDVLRLRVIEQRIAKAREDAQAGHFDAARDRYRLAIEASPESAFLHRELSAVELKAGRLDEALEAARKAVELDTTDARALVALGEAHEARSEFEAATRAFEQAAALEPSPDLANRIERLRERAALASLPASYHAIGEAETVTRGELAALIGVRLDQLVASVDRPSSVVITDTRGHWAASWILTVSRAGLMEVYPNHTFQPAATVRRVDFAATLARTIEVVATRDPNQGRAWREAQPLFEDLAAGHPSYPAASLAVAAGLLSPIDGNTFQLARPVSGAEACAAIERLRALWNRRP